MASNVNQSCAVWSCKIMKGSVRWMPTRMQMVKRVKIRNRVLWLEHLKSVLSKDHRYELEAYKLYWITDITPHEALPMKEDGGRHFLRFVSYELGVWYEDHSSNSFCGVVPDPKIKKIVKGNKFDKKQVDH